MINEKSTYSYSLKNIRLIANKNLSEELLVACSAFITENDSHLSVTDNLEVLLYAMNASSFLNLSEEALKFAEMYFELLPSDIAAETSALLLYSSLLFKNGEYIKVEKLLEIWKLQAFTGGPPQDDCNFLNVSASCFSMKKNFIKAAEYMEQALILAQESKLTTLSVRISVNLGAIFNYLNKKEEALCILEDAYIQSLSCDSLSLTGHALGTLISSLVNSDKIDRAELLARDVLQNSNQQSQKELRVSVILQLAKILQNKDNLDEAILIMEQSLPELVDEIDWQLIELFYNRLIDLHEKNCNFKKAYEILQVFKNRSDSVLSTQSEEHLINTKKMMDISAKTRQAELLSIKNVELKKSNTSLHLALEKVKSLSGIIPVCSYCKKMRNDEGYWNSLEIYLSNHSEAHLSQSICPDCKKKIT